jgi:hypothetical protein
LCSIRFIIFLAILQDTYLSQCLCYAKALCMLAPLYYCIFSEKLASTIYQGFNVPHLLHLFITKIKYHHAPNNAIAVKIAGWIKGHIQTRKMNALCLPSFSSRILDLGYISSACCLGLLGVKVGTILWTLYRCCYLLNDIMLKIYLHHKYSMNKLWTQFIGSRYICFT